MDKFFYVIYINPKENIDTNIVKKEMDKALDWFRINSNLWIVYSCSEIDKWMVRLQKLVEPDGSLFISQLKPNINNGWMTREFWDWFNKKENNDYQ